MSFGDPHPSFFIFSQQCFHPLECKDCGRCKDFGKKLQDLLDVKKFYMNRKGRGTLNTAVQGPEKHVGFCITNSDSGIFKKM